MICISVGGSFPLTPSNSEFHQLFSFHFFHCLDHQRTNKRPGRIELSSNCRRRCIVRYTFVSLASLIQWPDGFESIVDVGMLFLVAVLKIVNDMASVSEQ